MPPLSISHYSGQILVVDDDPVISQAIEAELEKVGFRVSHARSLAEMWERLGERVYDAILLDLFLDGEDGLEELPAIVRECPFSKVVVMSSYGTVEVVVDAMEMGATTFVSKSDDLREVVTSLKERLLSSVLPAEEYVDVADGTPLGIIGRSAAIQKLLAKIEQVKDVDSTVLITGESGTGKELAARAIHRTSPRYKNRFDAINCAAIPENLLESELFGHRRGAFTDAKSDRKGLFELCSEGTLFLDEVGELPLHLQVKLLRVLQEKEITPVGSSTSIPVNTRIVTATNRHLVELVWDKLFREDLFYRLAVLHIELPPLRDRKDDIELLTEHFVQKFCKRFSRTILPPSSELMARLNAYHWPGNVRELQNAVERGVVLARTDELQFEDMFDSELRPDLGEGATAGQHHEEAFWTQPLSEAKQEFEKEYLKHLLEQTRGNISEVARISGRYRTDVYRLLSKHGVDWEDFRP
ncbi:MAG: sigma-54 dependent transcriptional regulator [Bdellovibrionota bacterium]